VRRLVLGLTTLALLAWTATGSAPTLPTPAPALPPLQGGTFPAQWIHGADCGNEPDIQVHAYNDDLYILRQSPCPDFEAPFLYLIFGSEKVLLVDTGSSAQVDLEPVVTSVIDDWLAMRGLTSIHLVVGHSHFHGDHIRNDSEFENRPDTTLVSTNPAQMQAFWGFTDWPNDTHTYDLGGRVLDILATPGHSGDGITFYDRDTQLLMTGDIVYPGRLYIFGAQLSAQWDVFRDSIARLADFASNNPVSWVVGCHVEMTATPRRDFALGTTYHPNEHVLQLDVQSLFDLNAALASEPSARPIVFDDFIVHPAF